MALQLIPLGAPAVDTYTPLAQLGQTFFKQYDDARKRRFEDDFAKSNADLIGGMTQGVTPAPAPQGGTLGEMGQPKPNRSVPSFVTATGTPDKQKFIETIMPHALAASQATGVDPRIIIGQAAIETGWGKSAPGNNYFGIKSHGQAGGNTMATTEIVNGQPVRVRDSFRAYASPGDSVAGYAEFLKNNPRYRPMMAAQGLDNQLSALQASGYATDPNYSAKVGSVARGIQIAQPSMGAQDGGDVLAGGAGPSSTPTPVQRPPMTPAGAMPQAPAPQQMAQAGPGADPFGFSRMPPQVAAAVKSMMANPLPAAQARAQSIIERYQKTEQWSDPVTDPRTGAEFQVNRVTGERKIFQQPQDSYTVETDGRGNMVQVNTRTNQRSILDKAEGWQVIKGADGNNYAWNPRNPQSQPLMIGQPGGTRSLTTLEERRAQGIADDDKRVVQIKPNGELVYPSKAQTEVNLNNAVEKELDKGFAKSDVDRYSGFVAKADQARGMLGDISTLREISRRVGSQGKTAEVKMALGPYAEALGIDVKDLSDLQAADAIIQRLAPQMHVPGSGATSDIEFKGFVKSLGSMTNNPQAREMIYDTFEAFARYDIARGKIVSQLKSKKITPTEAEDKIEALGDPLTRYREWKKTNGSTEAAAPEVAPPGKRAPLPDGYTASRMVNEAKRALKVAPGAKSEIADKLRSHGIDPKVLD